MSNSKFPEMQFCLATVTTDSFMPGTLVMLYSFLKHNSWFNGDITIIHNELAVEHQQVLSLLYSKVQFLQVNSSLLSQISGLIDELPDFTSRQARYYSLETFRLRNYHKVLFCDSDLEFRQSIKSLFDLSPPFIACGDGAYYQGCGRDWGAGFNKPADIKSKKLLHNTFNSGFFLVDNSLLTDKNYSELIKLVDSRIYQSAEMVMTDQVILNLYFAGQQHLISGTYNYLLAYHDLIYKFAGINLTDAHVVHFNGQYKPWNALDMLHNGLQDPIFLKAGDSWSKRYTECLQQIYMQTQLQKFKGDNS